MVIGFLTWISLPSLNQLKPKVMGFCSKFVPGGTEDDLIFYWRHWFMRLIVGLGVASVGAILWERSAEAEVVLVLERVLGLLWMLVIGYMAVGKWRQWRAR